MQCTEWDGNWTPVKIIALTEPASSQNHRKGYKRQRTQTFLPEVSEKTSKTSLATLKSAGGFPCPPKYNTIRPGVTRKGKKNTERNQKANTTRAGTNFTLIAFRG